MYKTMATLDNWKMGKDVTSYMMVFLDYEDWKSLRDVNQCLNRWVTGFLGSQKQPLEGTILTGSIGKGLDDLRKKFCPVQPRNRGFFSLFQCGVAANRVMPDGCGRPHHFATNWEWFGTLFKGIVQVEKEQERVEILTVALGPIYAFMCPTKKVTPVRLVDESGLRFSGTIKDGERQRGTLTTPEGKIIYEGDWIEDRPALGPQQFPLSQIDSDGQEYGVFYDRYTCYQGQVSEGFFKGLGRLIEYESSLSGFYGAVYWGQFDRGLPQGDGQRFIQVTSRNVIIEKGQWEQGKLHGTGDFTSYRNNIIVEQYKGDYREDCRHGRGKWFQRDSKTGNRLHYEGGYAGNRWHGEGAFSICDNHGDEIENFTGHFSRDKRNGKGVYGRRKRDGFWRISQGSWLKDKRHGEFVEYIVSPEGLTLTKSLSYWCKGRSLMKKRQDSSCQIM